jgi:hypothetical protein
MPLIQSPQDLLVHLAGNGDPSAFFTLAAPCARSTYVFLRNQGKNHGEAMTLLVPFLKKIHKNYLTGSRDVPFNVWYESQRKKLVPGAMDSQDEKKLPENISSDDISHFESQMKLVFQQNYGKLRRFKNVSGTRRWIFSRFLPKLATVVLGLLVIGAGLQIFLSLTGITISVSSAGHNILLSLPSAINKHFFSIATPAMQKPVDATTPAASKADSTQPQKPLKNPAPDSSLSKETMPVVPRQDAGTAPAVAVNRDNISKQLPVKKPASSRRHASTASSAGLAIPPAPAASSKSLSDSETVQSQYPSNPAQAEKSASITEKTASLPSFQKKQPASLPESSIIAP